MNQNSAEFTYLKNTFPTMSDAKTKEGFYFFFVFYFVL